MAVHSNTFGGLQLSGEDATKFRNQTRSAYKSKAAATTVMKGVASAQRLLKDGQVKAAKA